MRLFSLLALLLLAPAALAQATVFAVADAEGDTLFTVRGDATVGGLTNVYHDRGQIRIGGTSRTLTPGQAGDAVAYCEDARDLPLTGFCALITGGDLRMISVVPLDWQSRGLPAGYACLYRNEGATSGTFSAGIVCLDVPSP